MPTPWMFPGVSDAAPACGHAGRKTTSRKVISGLGSSASASAPKGKSGSMAGEKMDQARRALKYCVKNLEDGDRFDIVTFSTEAEAWRGQLSSAKTDRAAVQSQ